MGTCATQPAPPVDYGDVAEKTVVIIGGGPSGVHMASKFAKAKYKEVIILERSDRFGGMSWTVRDQNEFPQEMGTCFGTSDTLMEATGLYKNVKELFAEYTPDTDTDGYVALANNQKAVSETDFVANEGGSPCLEGFVPWISGNTAEKVHPHLAKLLPDIGDTLVGLGVMESESAKYCKIWEEIFGKETDEYVLPRPRKAKHWEWISMPFENFLEMHKLGGLTPVMLLTYTMFGYGTFQSTPSYYPLWWFRPSFMDGIMNIWSKIADTPMTSITKNGYQTLWLAMLKAHEDKISAMKRCNVKQIQRSTDGITVSYDHTDDNGETSDKQVECDILFIACGLDHALDFLDASKEEQDVFSKVERWNLATSFVTFDGSDRSRNLPADTLFPGPLRAADGRVVEFRMTQNVLYPLLGGVVDRDGPPAAGRAIVKQVLDDPENRPVYNAETFPANLAGHRDKFLKESGFENVQVEHSISWAYFPHFSSDSVKKGLPWAARDMQGKFNTYYIGDCLSFESIKDVVSYNDSLWNSKFVLV